MEKENFEDYGVVQVASNLFYVRTLIVNVCFAGKPKESDEEKPDWVLLDAGMAGTAGKIKDAAGVLYGKGNRPKAIILTHAHFDHIGALEELLKDWQVPVFAHPQEIPYLTGKESYPPPDPSVSDGLMAKISPLYPRDPVDIGQSVQTLPEDGSVPFMSGWRWIAAPGHTPGQVVLFRDSDGVLIAGDAFTTVKQESALAVMTQKEEVHAPPGYFTMNWSEAGKSIQRIAELNPRVVITGHGKPMSGEELKTELRELSENFERESIPNHGEYVEHPVPMGEASYAQTHGGD